MTQELSETGKGLIGGVERVDIQLHDYNPGWAAVFAMHATRIREALGRAALRVEHIGSTAVPGLLAKPIIDILLVVANSADEGSYLPALERAGYQLRVREPACDEHRMLRTPNRDVHVHVYSSGCREIDRCLIFRDRLRADRADRELYAETKRGLAIHAWPDMNAYAAAKGDVIEAIIEVTRPPTAPFTPQCSRGIRGGGVFA